MKVCPYCREDLPNDTIYCTHCGKPLEKISQALVEEKFERNNTEKGQQQVQPEVEAERNFWTSFGMGLFLIALVALDAIIATIFKAMNIDYKIIFVLSTILYIGAICCGVIAIVKDYKAKKQKRPINTNYPMALAEIFISFYIILVNVQQVLLN